MGRFRRLGDAASSRPRGRPRRLAVHDRPRERADRADAPGERRHRGGRRRSGSPERGPVRDRGAGHGPHDPARPSPGDAVPRGAPLPERVVQLGGAGVIADRLRVRDRDHRRRRVRRPRPVWRPGRPAARARRARRTDGRRGAGVGLRGPPAVVAARDARGPRRERGALVGHVDLDSVGRDRAGGSRARGLRLRLRADGHAALHGGSGIGRPSVVRDRLGRRHGFAHDRHGDRPRHPDRLRVDDDRPVVRPAVRDAGGARRSSPRTSATGRCATCSSWKRSRTGRRARRPGSWSGCSWSRPE